MMPPLWAIAGGGALLAGLAGGWTVRDWKADSDALEAEEKAQALYEARVADLAEQSLRYEQLAQTLRASERTDRETIRETFRNVEVPAVCTPPAGIISVLDNAVGRANSAAAGQSFGTVPDATPPPR
jgi:hypothetical protein